MDTQQFDQFVDEMIDKEQCDEAQDLGSFQDYHDYMLKVALEGPNFDSYTDNSLSDY